MNERIKELALQAGCDILFNDDGSGIAKEDGIFFDVESFEKFARLIVKECAERLMQDDFGSVKGVMSIAGARLKEHFGIQ